MHNERLISYLEKLFYKLIDEEFSEEELFILLCSIWLHDIGLSVKNNRNKHTDFSVDFINTYKDKLGLLDDESIITSLICKSHNDIININALPYSQFNIRIKLIGVILYYIDNIDSILSINLIFDDDYNQENRKINNIVIPRIEFDIKNNITQYIFIEGISETTIINKIKNKYDKITSYINNTLDSYGLSKYHIKSEYKPIPIVTHGNIKVNQVMDMLYINQNTKISIDTILNNPVIIDYSNTIKILEKQLKEDLIRRGRSIQNYPNQFIIYKRWNSTSPIFSINESNGGGYFLIWRKKGIVIDPGFNYINNFLKSYSIEDIDIVIVTHDHPDHCNDIPKILTCLYDINKVKEKNGDKPHDILFLVSYGTYFRFSIMFSQNEHTSVRKILPNNTISLNEYNFSIQTTPTKHKELLGDDTGFGLKMTLNYRGKSYVIGISSDTRYFSELSNIFDNVQMFIAHIGTLEDVEKTSFHPNHLGLKGILNLVSNMTTAPDLLLISEFGEEMKGFRVNISNIIQSYLLSQKMKTLCFPTDLYMNIKLPSLLIKSSNSPEYYPPKEIKCIEYQSKPEITYLKK